MLIPELVEIANDLLIMTVALLVVLSLSIAHLAERAAADQVALVTRVKLGRMSFRLRYLTTLAVILAAACIFSREVVARFYLPGLAAATACCLTALGYVVNIYADAHFQEERHRQASQGPDDKK